MTSTWSARSETRASWADADGALVPSTMSNDVTSGVGAHALRRAESWLGRQGAHGDVDERPRADEQGLAGQSPAVAAWMVVRSCSVERVAHRDGAGPSRVAERAGHGVDAPATTDWGIDHGGQRRQGVQPPRAAGRAASTRQSSVACRGVPPTCRMPPRTVRRRAGLATATTACDRAPRRETRSRRERLPRSRESTFFTTTGAERTRAGSHAEAVGCLVAGPTTGVGVEGDDLRRSGSRPAVSGRRNCAKRAKERERRTLRHR